MANTMNSTSRIACWAWLTASLSVACSSAVSTPNRAQLSPREIVERSKPAIVRIEAKADAGVQVGTGFIVGADGLIATNLHVIHDAAQVRVTLLDGTSLPVLQVVAVDPQRDLAILAVDSSAELPTLRIGNSDEVSAGDQVLAIGNPLGLFDYTVSDGLISAVRPINEVVTVLQISAPISQGSSGGPLFNYYGEVIGVATAIVGAGQNLNIGIPVNYLRPLLAQDRGKAISLAELRERLAALRPPDSESESSAEGRIVRKVPTHDASILEGCSDDSLATTVEAIQQAIHNGAPLYNAGNHEACFRIYEGTTIRLERELDCPGLRDALGQGLLRAKTLETFTEKAWALRDTFDGVIFLFARQQDAGGKN